MGDYNLTGNDYVELWKHYQSRADSIKQSMFKNTTWLLGFTSAVLAFTMDNFVTFDASGTTASQPIIALAICGVGVALCGYALVMLEEFGRHIKDNWDDADYFRGSIVGMPPLRDGSFLPGMIWNRLEIVVGMFLAAFIVLGIFFVNSIP